MTPEAFTRWLAEMKAAGLAAKIHAHWIPARIFVEKSLISRLTHPSHLDRLSVINKGVTQMTTTYRAYETKNGQAVKVLRTGSYEVLRAWADKQEAKNYAKTQVHNPIWVDAEIYSVAR